MSIDNSTSELAGKWARRLEGPDLTETERAALQHWLLADPTRADALGEACYVFATAGALSAEKRAEILALPEAERGEETSANEASPTAQARPRRHWRAYALAASALFATVLGILWFAANAGWLPQTYKTGTSEIRTVQLPDGSVVRLNAKTTIRWTGFGRERRAELVAGQALFQIVHDPAQPFSVRADHGLVRVLGTKFDLQRRTDATILTVLEGSVEVRNAAESADDMWQRIVYADQRLAYDSRGLIDDVRPVDASKAVRWQEFTLDLDRELLSAVIEELSRYTDQPIVLGDDRLKTQRIIGTLRVRDVREAFRDLEAIAPVVVRQDGAAFVLYQHSNKPPSGQ